MIKTQTHSPFRHVTTKMFSLGEGRLVHDLHYGDPAFSLHHRMESMSGGGGGGGSGGSGSGSDNGNGNGASRPVVPSNATFDCVLQVQTQLPKGDKSRRQHEALSLVVVQLMYGPHPQPPEYIQVLPTYGAT